MKQIIRLAEKPIQARITIPGSKSITNRALLLAALAGGVSELFQVLFSDDTEAFIEALRQLGIVVQVNKVAESCIVGGCDGIFPKKEAAIWCADAGTVLRFIVAACASSGGSYSFDGSAQLKERPIEMLLNVLHRQGAEIIPRLAKKMPFTIRGISGLDGGEIDIESGESGQFVSALLMVAPFAHLPMVIEAHDLVSKSYVEMTCKMMAEFGVVVHRIHQERFLVPTPQRYTARNYLIEADLTTASYFFAAAAVTGGKVTIQPLDIKTSKQGDVKFLEILEKMGCQVINDSAGLTVQGSTELHGVSVDMRDCSDTFMTLAAIAPFAKTPTTITNIGHTRLQESNRISVMRQELDKLNIKAEEGHDWIKVYPSAPVGNKVDAHADHRIAMSLAIIGLRTAGVEVDGAECVAKTCPEFFHLWDSLLLQ